MTSRDVTLLNSFVDYVLDVKPYHSKIKEFLSELFFSDSFNVNVSDNLNWTVYHQNQWTIDDVAGYRLQRMCEGLPIDLTFRIPADIWPRFSLNDNPGQTPPGDDPTAWDGITSSYSHIPIGDPNWAIIKDDYLVDGNPKKFRVSFHQGSRVYVDGVEKVYNVDYFVDNSRGFILFDQIPVGNFISIQLFKVDRLFIAFNYPFDSAVDRGYDMYAYDLLPYDSDDDIVGSDADAWNIVVDSASPEGYLPVVFYNSYGPNHAKAQLTVKSISGIDGDYWRVTAIGPWSFKVQKNETGQIWFAYFKSVFDNGQISFIIDKVWSDYYLVLDSNTYDPLLSPPGDVTDFLVDRTIVTEHGVVVDPVPPKHRPMEFVMNAVDIGGEHYPSFTIGRVKQITETMISGPANYYAFVLDEVPGRGTYVELQVEQNGQLNPWVNANIKDDMYLKVTWTNDETIDLLDPYDIFDYDNHEYDMSTLVIPAGTIRNIHNVYVHKNLEYTETTSVDELVLIHSQGVVATNVVVKDNFGVIIPMTLTWVDMIYEGIQLPVGYIGIDNQQIVINLVSPQPITVTLTF